MARLVKAFVSVDISANNIQELGEQKVEKAAPEKIPDEMQKNANPGDTATTKGILDDAVVQSFEDAGFAEDHRLSNLKLFLGALACTFALIAQVCLNDESLSS